MTTTPVLRGTTRADLLAIPAFLLGFRPDESVVIMGLRGNTVIFSARLDVGWYATHFEAAAHQICSAAGRLGEVQFVLLGYSADLDEAWRSTTAAADIVGRANVLEALITEGTHYWSLPDGQGPEPFDFDASPLTAQAVFTGVNVHATRAEAVAPVTQWEPAHQPEVASAEGIVESLTPDEALELLAHLAEAEPPVTDEDALVLALLLEDEDCAAALLAALSCANAEVVCANLAAARRRAPKGQVPTLLALLGIACWLAGKGAQMTSCIEQLEEFIDTSPPGELLRRLHQHGIAPECWDRHE